MKNVYVFLALTIACGASQVEPDDMSALEHDEEAARHDEEAEAHQGNESAIQTGSVATPGIAQFEYGPEIYNPGPLHDQEAEQHRELAAQHRAAAEALRSFEAQECGSFPPDTRASCPLLGQLAAVEDVDGGVRLTFAEGVNAEAAHAHVRCHVAFAGTQGREGMDDCPMYLPGVRVESVEGTTVLLTDDADSVAELRRRARAHLSHTH